MTMRIINLGGGSDYDGIYDRRGRSRRSDGTYMGYRGGVYNTFGKVDELEEREAELEQRERELEERERQHEREDRMYREGWFGERVPRDEFDGYDPRMRRSYRRGMRYY